MTNEIKPGYYWAKTEDGESILVEWMQTHYQCVKKLYGYWEDQLEIIAPVLPPEQWPKEVPEYGSMDEVADAGYITGFRECYKLFTGKELE